ncbi:MAG: response regulator, partial [Proteobacteria bacterium]|nr:response regulator [Pseudomonadota bacterium]
MDLAIDKSAFNSSRVLIVDDSKTARNQLLTILKSRNYIIRYAANGEEAVKVAEEFNPSLILMDVMMPIMDGIEACELIRSI